MYNNYLVKHVDKILKVLNTRYLLMFHVFTEVVSQFI